MAHNQLGYSPKRSRPCDIARHNSPFCLQLPNGPLCPIHTCNFVTALPQHKAKITEGAGQAGHVQQVTQQNAADSCSGCRRQHMSTSDDTPARPLSTMQRPSAQCNHGTGRSKRKAEIRHNSEMLWWLAGFWHTCAPGCPAAVQRDAAPAGAECGAPTLLSASFSCCCACAAQDPHGAGHVRWAMRYVAQLRRTAD